MRCSRRKNLCAIGDGAWLGEWRDAFGNRHSGCGDLYWIGPTGDVEPWHGFYGEGFFASSGNGDGSSGGTDDWAGAGTVAASKDPCDFDPEWEDFSKTNRRRTEGQGSPALRGDPDHEEQVLARTARPTYRINPARSPGRSTFKPRKTPEPSDAESIYQNSIRANNRHSWFGKGQNNQIYRFLEDNAGGAHFSGIVPRSSVPRDVLRQLGL